jgi:GTP-binding protein
MFIDQAKTTVMAGNGGNGCMSFRREKFVSRGGPDGGDGGRGGHIYFVGDKMLHTLQDLRYHNKYKAENGHNGKGSNMSGKDGKDIYIRVPVGTVIHDGDKNILVDINEDGQQELIVRSGKGGKGNQHFATPTRQTPTKATPGGTGEEKELVLELKLIADVGLVGKPNAGKSTLISRMSSARPKIADYPFTTLYPVLGIVKTGDYSSFIMADIPGLISGAHDGKGLGHRFLRHIERTRLLIFLIDLSDPDPKATLKELKHELSCYNKELLKKKSLVVYNKVDLFEKPPLRAAKSAIMISAVQGTGLPLLKQKIFKLLQT